MRMHFGDELQIEDQGNHAASAVISLGILLAGGANLTPDPKRQGFYEVGTDSTVYYIYVSPATGTIFLLAMWENAPAYGWESPFVSSA
jgi:hypothetical protein